MSGARFPSLTYYGQYGEEILILYFFYITLKTWVISLYVNCWQFSAVYLPWLRFQPPGPWAPVSCHWCSVYISFQWRYVMSSSPPSWAPWSQSSVCWWAACQSCQCPEPFVLEYQSWWVWYRCWWRLSVGASLSWAATPPPSTAMLVKSWHSWVGVTESVVEQQQVVTIH